MNGERFIRRATSFLRRVLARDRAGGRRRARRGEQHGGGRGLRGGGRTARVLSVAAALALAGAVIATVALASGE